MKRVMDAGLEVENWERKRGSWDQKRRMSGIEKRSIAMRSRPRPKAQPTWEGTPALGVLLAVYVKVRLDP
jgi:hypothetical protein